MGSLKGVQGGDGSGIYGESHDDSAWAGGRGTPELENPGHKGREMYTSNGLHVQGRPADLPGEGMSGTSGDDDSNAGTLPTLAFT